MHRMTKPLTSLTPHRSCAAARLPVERDVILTRALPRSSIWPPDRALSWSSDRYGFQFLAAAYLLILLTGCNLLGESNVASNPYSADTEYIPELDDEPSRFSTLTKRFKGPIALVSASEPDEQAAGETLQAAEQKYRAALAAKAQGQSSAPELFVASAKLYMEASQLWPKSRLEEDALFMAAECQFFADRYPKASKAYELLVKKYPNSKYMDQIAVRQFKLAEYWLDLEKSSSSWSITSLTDPKRPKFDTFGNALRVFDKIRFEDPTGKLSDDATMAAANACFEAQRFARADTLYDDLRESFPQSAHQFNAHLLGLKCKRELYEGPEYDGTVLDEAEELVKRMFRLFPHEAEQHRTQLTAAMRDIRLKKAEREWTMAKYYDRRNEYAAARQYYQIVRTEFSDTSLAQEAAARLAEIGELPDVPPDRLKWLSNLFPEPKRAKPLIAYESLPKLR